jgi:predicted site-specific integrase-resolvase
VVSEIAVAQRKRFRRFCIDLFAWILQDESSKLEVRNTARKKRDGSGFNELTDDLLAITNYCSAKYNGKRSPKYRKGSKPGKDNGCFRDEERKAYANNFTENQI